MNNPETKPTSTSRVVRDKEFAERLETACEGNPHCPTDQYRGKQKWIYDNLLEKFGHKVSPEAVRKWFAGESRPRPKMLKMLAQILEVDEAWLAVGAKPEFTEKEKRVRNALADGSVNLVAGLIQRLGGNIAFSEANDDGTDIYAIINGHKRDIVVKSSLDAQGSNLRFAVDIRSEGKVVVGVIGKPGAIAFELVRIPFELVKEHGKLRGDFYEVQVARKGGGYSIAGTPLPPIEGLADLDDGVK